MKKSLKLLVSFILIIIFTLTLCACDGRKHLNEENCDDNHDLKQLSYTAPTCKTNGQQVLKCSKCDYTETKTLLSIEHDYIDKSKTPSTCSQHGTQVLECSMCHTKTNKELPLLDHNYELISETPSTCSIKGIKNYKCKDCDDVYMEELELLRHQYSTINTATCFSNGNIKNICDNCQYEEVLEDTSILSHEFDSDGYCNKCGIYKTLFNEDELGVTWEPYQSNDKTHIFDDIHGYLKPKFNNDNTIPNEYFIEHTIFLNLSFYDLENKFLESKEFSSFIIPWDGFGHKGKPSIQVGNQSNGYAYEFFLRFWLQQIFEESTLSDAISFKLELSCEGYKTIEKTYEIEK